MRKIRMKFQIKLNDCVGYYYIVALNNPIRTLEGTWVTSYLRNDGTVGAWKKGNCYWYSKEEAEDFIRDWERKNMNDVEAKLEQAKKDRDAIEKNIRELEEKLKTNVPMLVENGMVFKIDECLYMKYFNPSDESVNITSLNRWAGSWFGSPYKGKFTEEELRKRLIKSNAVYVGKFNDIFRKV